MYVLAHFRDDVEALHYAISADGYDWELLNDGEPILESAVGNESIRDPFLIQDHQGTYHLLGTDSWESDSIVHATSPDLIDWTPPTLLPLMSDIPSSRNTWAPEAFYDRECGVYRLLWSSTLDSPDAWDNRIWSSTTADFESFSTPAVFFDPGYEAIDACVVRAGEEYLMAFNDKRGSNTLDTDHNDICLARSPSGGGPFGDLSKPVTPHAVEGPTLFHTGEEWLMFYDHYVEGRYGASRSDDTHEWTVCDQEVNFPAGIRHGDVIEVNETVGKRLRKRF